MKKHQRLSVSVLVLAAVFSACSHAPKPMAKADGPKPKVYWFIPDGLRADDGQFNIYEWAEKGELPNLKRLMREGSYGYSWPVFPGHTPTNYATLFTGTTPDVHGIADGAMRAVGYPLDKVARGGFNSLAKLVPPIWMNAEQASYLVALLSVPGSTPPQLARGATIRGRWGGWGIDFPAINFHTKDDHELMLKMGHDRRVFTFGSDLTRFSSASAPKGWQLALPRSYSPAREIEVSNWNQKMYAYLYDTTDDHVENYDRVLFSKNKSARFADLGVDSWSDWLPVKLTWPLPKAAPGTPPNKTTAWSRGLSKVELPTQVKIRVIRLGKRDQFRIRFFYNNLNKYLTSPPEIADAMNKAIGPMVDFVDNFPPQLIYFPEDKNAFLEESRMSLDWHQKAVSYLEKELKSDFIIHSIYTPNQMLTSRWWMPFVDKTSAQYDKVDETERARLWAEVKEMYVGIDKVLGEIMKNADANTYVFFSSDHGNVPLYKEVRLNNLFAKKGWLTYKFEETTGEFTIDWAKTKVIFLMMNNIYINPNGLAGPYVRATGPEYEKLRSEVLATIDELKSDRDGKSVLSHAWRWEDAGEAGMPQDRVGDLIIANRTGFGWIEALSPDGQVFRDSLKGGYKQAIEPKTTRGMLTPFVAWGPGIKAGNALSEPIEHVDQYRTILHLLGMPVPSFAKGRVLTEVLAK